MPITPVFLLTWNKRKCKVCLPSKFGYNKCLVGKQLKLLSNVQDLAYLLNLFSIISLCLIVFHYHKYK